MALHDEQHKVRVLTLELESVKGRLRAYQVPPRPQLAHVLRGRAPMDAQRGRRRPPTPRPRALRDGEQRRRLTQQRRAQVLEPEVATLRNTVQHQQAAAAEQARNHKMQLEEARDEFCEFRLALQQVPRRGRRRLSLACATTATATATVAA